MKLRMGMHCAYKTAAFLLLWLKRTRALGVSVPWTAVSDFDMQTSRFHGANF